MDDAIARRGIGTRLWAGIGLLSLLFATYCFIDWIASGNYMPRGIGTDEPTSGQKAFAIFSHALNIGACMWVYWHFVVKPWRADGRVSDDGIFVMAMHAMWFPYDLFINSFVPTFIYSSWGPVLGGWMANVPTTLTPNAEFLPATPLVSAFAYPWSIFFPAVIACSFVKKWQARYPQRSYLTHFALIYAFLFVFGLQELVSVYFQFMAFPTVIGSLTLFPGEVYQLPVYETAFYSLMMVIFAAFRYFRDERGLTVVERSVDEITRTPRQRFIYRFLAVHGFCVAVFLLSYNIPEALVSMHSDTYAKDLPSFLNNDVCGTPRSGDVPCIRSGEMPLPRDEE